MDNKFSLKLLILQIMSIIAFFSFVSCSSPKSSTFVGIDMVLVPSGKVQAFWIGKYEVTQKQYAEIMKVNPSENKGSPNNPVEKVDWYDAVEFCNKLSEKAGLSSYYIIDKEKKDPENTYVYDTLKWTVSINKNSNGFRLPTSGEWEYAYRAGTSTNFYWGNEFNGDYCWYDKNSNGKSNIVGQKKPNKWDLYDMSGNVEEWCFDWAPDAVGVRRVARGGSYSIESNFIEVFYHIMNINNVGSWVTCAPVGSLGFRIAKNK